MACGIAVAAPPTLETIAVTPTGKSISIGQKQSFTATGTFSDGSRHALAAAIEALAPGDTSTCVLQKRGGLDCWGLNDEGQLGDGTTVDSLKGRPVKWITNAKALAVSAGHGCALLARGAIQCWGRNDSGQLGNGTLIDSTRPVAVTGMRRATALAAGEEHGCALLAGGTVQCWGENFYGDLGNGSNVRSAVPVTVVGLRTATAVTTGNAGSCALLASGEVRCWGANLYGQLGDGTTTDSNTPVSVSGITSATAIAAGAHFNCALLAGGSVECWGHGGNGELGNGSSWPYADSSVPVPVMGISTAVAITAGAYHACAVLQDGSAQCWGYNNYGQLGDDTTTVSASNFPLTVTAISSPVRLAAGYWHTCALLADGAMRCWGRDDQGQLGNRQRNNLPNRSPLNVIGTPGVEWTSGDPSKATVSGRGLATARGVGSTAIMATAAGGIADSTVLMVQ